MAVFQSFDNINKLDQEYFHMTLSEHKNFQSNAKITIAYFFYANLFISFT